MMFWLEIGKKAFNIRFAGPFAPEEKVVDVEILEGESGNDFCRRFVEAAISQGVEIPDDFREHFLGA